MKAVAIEIALDHVQREALTKAAKIICDEAKAEVGTYQGAAGNTPAWDPLSAATRADRVAKGFTEDDPLLRTGELRDSISFEVTGDEAVIGSDSPIAKFHELGTPTIPQRSFLAGAAYRKADEVVATIGSAIALTIAGKGLI